MKKAIFKLLCFIPLLFNDGAHAIERTLNFGSVHLPPFSYEQNGHIKGKSVEIAQDACNKSAITCTFAVFPIKRLVEKIRSHKTDVITVLGKNERNRDWLYFSEPYAETEYGLFSRQKVPFSDLQSLRGRKVMVLTNSNMARALYVIQKDLNNSFEVIEDINLESMVRKIASGRFGNDTFLFGNVDIINSLIEERKIDNLHYIFETNRINYYFAIEKTNQKRALFNEFLLVAPSLKSAKIE